MTSNMNIMLLLSPSMRSLEEQTRSSAASAYIKAFLALLGIMLIIYLLTELTPFAARFIDKYLGGIMKDRDERDSGNAPEHNVYDIYDGDNNFKSGGGSQADARDGDTPPSDS